jgi:hypothetical protein
VGVRVVGVFGWRSMGSGMVVEGRVGAGVLVGEVVDDMVDSRIGRLC